MLLWAVLYRRNKIHYLPLKKLLCNVGRQLKRQTKLLTLWLLWLPENKTHSKLLKWRIVFIARIQSSHRIKGHEIKFRRASGEIERNRSSWLLSPFSSTGAQTLLSSLLLVSSTFLSLQNSVLLLLINLWAVAITVNLQDSLTTHCQQSYVLYQVLKVGFVWPCSSRAAGSHNVRFLANC